MKKERFVLAFFTGCLISAVSLQAQTGKDSTKVARSYAINEVVVTGTRSETDVRHLPIQPQRLLIPQKQPQPLPRHRYRQLQQLPPQQQKMAALEIAEMW